MDESLKEILQQKEERLQAVPEAFTTSVEKSQLQILKKLIRLLDQLEREGGKILISNENVAKIQEIAEQLLFITFNDTEYSEALKTFSSEFNVQAKLSRDYIKAISVEFQNKESYKSALVQSQKNALELLQRSGVNQVFINPMKDVLLASVTSGGSFTDLVESMQEVIMGDGKTDGLLLRHAKQVAFDGFAFSDASYIKMISDDLNYEFFQWFGGKLKDSRYLCATHSNQILHKKEIEHIGDTPSMWNAPPGSPYQGGGRIPETNASTIWMYRGGYRCQHQIVPVASTQVPQEAIDRAINKGFIK